MAHAPTTNHELRATNSPWSRPHLLGLEGLTAEELNCILDTAEGFADVSLGSANKVSALRGRVVVNLFFEDSTRTRFSFSLAAQRLSADVLEFTKSGSSLAKGETLVDTARNLEAMGVDIMVVRHGAPGAPALLSRRVNCSIVNAGDGAHEHPTQGLLDLFTIRQIKKKIAGLKVAIVGDIAHSRVARSNLWGLSTLGAKVFLVGPTTLVSSDFEELGATVCHDLDEILPEMDVINMLRVQFERMASPPFPSAREYSRMFGLNSDRLARGKADLMVMHPGPINRGVEIEADVADGPQSAILQQVSNGLATRMAVLFLVNQARESGAAAAGA